MIVLRCTKRLLQASTVKPVVEQTDAGFSAYSPDLPGCASTGATRAEVEENMREAIEFHLEGLRLEGYPIPEPTSQSSYVDVGA